MLLKRPVVVTLGVVFVVGSTVVDADVVVSSAVVLALVGCAVDASVVVTLVVALGRRCWGGEGWRGWRKKKTFKAILERNSRQPKECSCINVELANICNSFRNPSRF